MTRQSVAPNAMTVAIGFRQGTPMRSEIEALDASRLTAATEVAATAIDRRFGTGPVAGQIQAPVITAIR